MQGCAPAQVQEPEPAPGAVPDITLNLPEANCVCVTEEEASDYTFLEKGYLALARGDYESSVQHFKRYGRLEKTAEAEWEAAIAIAYLSSLSDSPFYDPEAARKSWRKLNKEDWQSMKLHQQSLMMRQSLETFIRLERESTKLEDNIVNLKEELEKREEAIKRLRELTLGQAGTPQ